MKVIKVKQVLFDGVKPKQLTLPFQKKKPEYVQMFFHFPKTGKGKKLDKLA